MAVSVQDLLDKIHFHVIYSTDKKKLQLQKLCARV